MKNLFEVMNENKTTTHNTKRIELNSGLTLSIQASDYHYCQPRMQGRSYDEYSSLEIGLPSNEIDLISKYAEDADDPTITDYGYVPVETVLELVEINGGVKGVVK